MLLVSFHGGSQGVNNVGAYSDDGTKIILEVLHDVDPKELSELRAFRVVNADGGQKLLWVLSGGKGESRIIAFSGSGDSYTHVKTIVEYPDLGSLLHPFDFTVAFPYVYVSNQDTDVVIRLKVDQEFLDAAPMPPPPSLPKDGRFLSGTFVACACHQLPGGIPPTTPISPPAGLEVKLNKSKTKVANSVRGVVWANGALFVADEVANTVKVYGDQGGYIGGVQVDPSVEKPKGPVHLMVTTDNKSGTDALYVCNGVNVYSGALSPNNPAGFKLSPVSGVDVPEVSGLAVAPDGTTLFAGSRHTKSVYRYKDFPAQPKLDRTFQVADAPEFLLYV